MALANESARVNVGHLTGVEVRQTAVEQHIATYKKRTPATVRRPENDDSLIRIRCRYCDAALSVRVFSTRRTLVKRWLWATMTTLNLLLFAGAVYMMASGRLDSLSPLIGGLSVAVELACCVGLGIGIGLLLLEHGVRLDSGSPVDVQHALLSRHGAVLGTLTRDGKVRNALGFRRRRRH